VDGTTSHAIDLREGATEAVVSGNVVSGGSAGIYLSGAAASVRRNTLTGALQHGISVVGNVKGSRIEGNTVAGRGSSAIDSSRAEGLDLRRGDNDVSGWEDTTPWLVTVKRFLQPLTLLWLALAALVVTTALLGLRRRAGIQHPYADKAPVSGPEDLVLVGAHDGAAQTR
jgi:parallel beta-helix repeat protein